MGKYRPPVVEKFLLEYETGLYTVTECCRIVDITYSAFFLWKAKYPEFKKRVEEADKKQLQNVKQLAMKGLIKLIQGQTIVETMVEYEWVDVTPESDDPLDTTPTERVYEQRIKRKIENSKTFLPDSKAVIFTLGKLDKENFGDEKKDPGTGQPVPVYIVQPGSIKLDLPSNFDEEPETPVADNASHTINVEEPETPAE